VEVAGSLNNKEMRTTQTWMPRGPKSSGRTPANHKNYRNKEAISQARYKTAQPNAIPFFHTQIQWSLHDIPNTVHRNGNNEYGQGLFDISSWAA
jgi:hypothetical protein